MEEDATNFTNQINNVVRPAELPRMSFVDQEQMQMYQDQANYFHDE